MTKEEYVHELGVRYAEIPVLWMLDKIEDFEYAGFQKASDSFRFVLMHWQFQKEEDEDDINESSL